MLIVTKGSVVIDNTGLLSWVHSLDDGLAHWREFRKPQLFPDADESALQFMWVSDDTDTAREMIRCCGRAVVDANGIFTFVEPTPVVNVQELRQQLGILVNERAAAVEMGEDTTAIQEEIEAIKAQIIAA
jgi:hypothetical protein